MRYLYLYLTILFVLSSLSVACMTSQGHIQTQYITEYKEVPVPTMCTVQKRERPVYNDNHSTANNLLDILLYTEILEIDLKYCRGDK